MSNLFYVVSYAKLWVHEKIDEKSSPVPICTEEGSLTFADFDG